MKPSRVEVPEAVLQRMYSGVSLFPKEGISRRPLPVEGSEFPLEVDQVIEAVGQSPNPIIQAMKDGKTAAVSIDLHVRWVYPLRSLCFFVGFVSQPGAVSAGVHIRFTHHASLISGSRIVWEASIEGVEPYAYLQSHQPKG